MSGTNWKRIEMEGKPYAAFWVWDGDAPLPEMGEVGRPQTRGVNENEREGDKARPPLRLVATSDVHGALYPWGQEGGNWFAALRAELDRDGAVGASGARLLINAGDDRGGGDRWERLEPEASAWWEAVAEHVDVWVPGNHDLDRGVGAFVAGVRAVGTKEPPKLQRLLLTNCAAGSPLAAVTAQALCFEFGKVRVGVLGVLTTEQTRAASAHLCNPVAAVEAWAKVLGPTVDHLIVVSHLGWPEGGGVAAEEPTTAVDDRALVAGLPANVFVVGAHTHRMLPPPEAGWTEASYGQAGQGAAAWLEAVWEGRWLARTRLRGELVPVVSTAVDAAFWRALEATEAAAGAVTFALPGLAAEEMRGERYRGESAHLEWAADALAAAIPGISEGREGKSLVGLCARVLGRERLAGKVDAARWCGVFPYADRFGWVDLPATALVPLLEANARRLDLPAHYLEARGWLQFDRRLRYRLRREDGDWRVGAIFYDGEPWQPRPGETLRLWSHAYVVEGFGGYQTVAAEAGLDWTKLPRGYASGVMRELLWAAAKTVASGADAPRLPDGRLRVVSRR